MPHFPRACLPTESTSGQGQRAEATRPSPFPRTRASRDGVPILRSPVLCWAHLPAPPTGKTAVARGSQVSGDDGLHLRRCTEYTCRHAHVHTHAPRSTSPLQPTELRHCSRSEGVTESPLPDVPQAPGKDGLHVVWRENWAALSLRCPMQLPCPSLLALGPSSLSGPRYPCSQPARACTWVQASTSSPQSSEQLGCVEAAA